MSAPGIDSCSLVPLYVEPHFGDMRLGGATAFLWMRPDAELALITDRKYGNSRRDSDISLLIPCITGAGTSPRMPKRTAQSASREKVGEIARTGADCESLWYGFTLQRAQNCALLAR